MRILLVEDDRDFSSTLSEELSALYSVDACYAAKEALDLTYLNPYDAVILDIGLPDMSGIELCAKLRERGGTFPILMLTGQTHLRDKVNALNGGADDYLTKPFELPELIARIRALMRRPTQPLVDPELSVADLRLNPYSRIVTRQGRPVRLRRKEFDLLEFLLRNEPNVVTREMILEHVWDSNVNSFTNAVDVHISRLREVIDKPFNFSLIETVHGLGYRISNLSQVDSST